jgi:hypothetical protein
METARERAKELFTSRFPEVTSEDIDRAANIVGPETRHGYLYVALDDRHFWQGAGHYLIYGSEYLCGIAAQLHVLKGCDYQWYLREHGIPTLFVCRLPIAQIQWSDRIQLAEALAHEIAADPQMESAEAGVIDFTFVLRSQLPPNAIVTHYHPRSVPDPLRGMLPYMCPRPMRS